MKIKNIFLTVLFSGAIATSGFSVGMGMGMGMGIPCGGPFPPCPVPIDTNLIILFFIGAIYGGYKLYKSLKKNPA
jgi:hypothetical protein